MLFRSLADGVVAIDPPRRGQFALSDRWELERAQLVQILELLEAVVLLTGFDNPVGDVHRMDWLSAGTARVLTRLVPTKRRMKTPSRLSPTGSY